MQEKERPFGLDTVEECVRTTEGIPVFRLANPALHSFCLCMYVRAGSMFEAAEENGITHFLEHLVFRSVNRQMKGELYRTLDRYGLSFEGVTYREFVRFSITGAPKHFRTAARILLRALSPLSLTAEDLRTERARVKAEIREDGERTTLDCFAESILHAGTSLSQPITGRAETLDRMSISRLKAKHREIFSAQNIFFYLSGNLTETDMDSFCTMLDDYGVDTEVARRENFAPVSEGFFHRGTVEVKNSRHHLVRISADIDLSRVKDAPLSLLYDILFGEGEECRMHQALSERTGYIYSFRASMELYRNVGTLSFLYEIPPSKMLDSVRIALDVLTEIKRSAEDALPFVRASYTENAAFVLDSDTELNWLRAYEGQILSLPYRTVAERAEAYAAVTAEEISETARTVFTPDNMMIALKGDRRRLPVAEMQALLAEMGAFVAPSKTDPITDSEQQCPDQAPLPDMP